MKIYSRKEFLKLGGGAAAAAFLASCGIGGNKKKKDIIIPGRPVTAKDTVKNKPMETLEVLGKGVTGYEALRKGFNLRIDKYPKWIAICESTTDVASAVYSAAHQKLPICVKSGGHSMEGFSSNDGGYMINLSKMNTVDFLEDGKIKVGPGCTLAGLYNEILPKGLLLPAGSCATVGIGGLTLGGGYGLFSRKYGLTCDHLVEATMVDGTGNIHNTKNDAELLWALKGGGNGNFGIVAEMIFTTHKAPETMQAHHFKACNLGATKASSILQKWMEVAPQLPEACFSAFVLNGKTLNILVTNYDVESDNLKSLLNKLVEVTDEHTNSIPEGLSKMLPNFYGVGHPVYFRNSSAGLFKNYKDVSPFMNQIFEKIVSTPGMLYQMNTLGGKINDAEFEKQSAFAHRNYDFVSELQAYWDKPSQDKHLADVTTEILKITQEHTDRQYVNYCSLEFTNWEKGLLWGKLPSITSHKTKI